MNESSPQKTERLKEWLGWEDIDTLFRVEVVLHNTNVREFIERYGERLYSEVGEHSNVLNLLGMSEFRLAMFINSADRMIRKPKGDRKEYDADDLVGIKNSTIDKKLGYLKWATDKGYNSNVAYKTFKPTLKATQKKVIYLSKDELKTILNLELKGDTLYLEPVRDIFMFCCFSSLRYSDASSLKWNDVKDGHIEVTTVKTADSLSIEINDMMGRILEKYRAVPDKRNNLVFPYYTNQAMNRDLKKLCKLAGINEEIRITSYKGNERIDEVKEKWELVGTHTGRKTFIVNALSRGIAPSIVMKWTGHNDYKSMKPYIDIVDSIKASEMSKMNFMD